MKDIDRLPGLKDLVEFARELSGAKDKDGRPLPLTRDDTVMQALYLIAMNTKHRDCVAAIKVWLDRTRGKVPDKMELGGAGDFDQVENPISTVLEGMLAKAKEAEEKDKKAKKGRGKTKPG
jgi:hypothetical protein